MQAIWQDKAEYFCANYCHDELEASEFIRVGKSSSAS
jgi:hypothetical protein